MKKIFAISRLTVLLNFRQGSFWGNALLIPIVFALIFFTVKSGGSIEGDLQIKTQYAMIAAYSLLTLSLLATACFTVRNQIDLRNFHLLSCYPIDRKHIWIGQFLGLLFLALCFEIILLTTMWTSQQVYIRGLEGDQKTQAENFISQPLIKEYAIQPSLTDLVHRQIEEEKIPHEKIDLNKWKDLYYSIRVEDFRLKPGTNKSYNFNLDKRPETGINLNYRLDSSKHKILLKGKFTLKGINQAVFSEYPIEFYPLKEYKIHIPAEDLPADGRFRITFYNLDSNYIHLKREKGLFISYEQGNHITNIAKTAFLHCIHLSITTIVGMTAGACLSFPVAIFISGLLYAVSLFAELLLRHTSNINGGYNRDFFDHFSEFTLELGLWLCKGLQPPGTINLLSSSLDISLITMFTTWVPGSIAYGIIIMIVGAIILDRKELERVQV